MKKLLAAFLFLASPAMAASDLDPWVEKAYNVRYFEINDVNPNDIYVSVIWYDQNDARFSAEQLCDLDERIGKVWWGSLGEYLKHHKDVSSAANEASYTCEKGR